MSNTHEASTASDEALARALQEQFENEYVAASSTEVPINDEFVENESPPTPGAPSAPPMVSADERSETDTMLPPPSTALVLPTEAVLTDECYARQLEQELHDEELARRLQAETPTGAVSSGMTDDQLARAAQSANPRRRRSCLILRLVASLVFVGGAIFIFLVAFGGADEGQFDFGWPDEDPWGGGNTNPDDANKWEAKTNGNGLKLEVVNALEDKWVGIFNEALAEWDAGNPDALTLSSKRVPHDRDCSSVPRKMKVCNGNYGATQWRGVNQVLLQNGYIISSVAKMNDHYLSNSGSAQKQYTMCHELGHGFGLPHTDEDFYNQDLGNCMDYTDNPAKNMHPDDMNFDLLKELYGTVGGSSSNSPDDGVLEGETSSNLVDNGEGGDEEGADGAVDDHDIHDRDEENNGSKKGKDGKKLRRRHHARRLAKAQTNKSLCASKEELPPEFNLFRRIVSEPLLVASVPGEQHAQVSGWRLLHSNEKGETHERNLGNGFKVKAHILRGW